jgi:hypothetical protein
MAERIGCQDPTYHVAAPYSVTMGRFMAEWERRMKGVTLNPWQLPIEDDWLALGPGLRYAHPRNLLMVPRQNGKTELALTRIDWGVAVLPLIRRKAGLPFRGERILYSAHEDSTVVEIFGRMQEYYGSKANDPECDYPHLNRMVRAVRKATAKYAIFFKPEYGGGAVYFATRTNSGKIGFAAIDAIIGDEAQYMTDVQQGAFLSTTSSAPLKNSQFIYLGTPPTPDVRGDVFQSMRDDVVEGRDAGEHGAISLSEWSVNDLYDEGFGDHTDEELWWRLNPAMGLNMQPSAPNVELGLYRYPLTFAQQRLGYWLPKAKAERGFIDPADWAACEVPKAAALGPDAGVAAVGVKYSPDGELVAWSVGVVPQVGAPYVELIDVRPAYGGTDEALAWIGERSRKLAAVVVDGQSGAADFVQRVRKLGISKRRVAEAGTAGYIEACSMILQAVGRHDLAHIAQAALDESMTMARRRKVGRSGIGLADGQDMPCVAAESAALALRGARTARNPDTGGRAGC